MKALPIKTGHLFIGVALLLAVFSAMLIQSMTANKQPMVAVKKEKVQKIAIAAAPVPAGSLLNEADYKFVKWPQELLPEGDVFTEDEQEELVGRMLKRDIFPGEPIFRQKLAGDTSIGGMPVLIPMGMRAVTIAVSEVKGVGGFVKPKDRVDVLATLDRTDDEGDSIHVTKTVLQNVMVLATAQQMIDERVNSLETNRKIRKLEDEKDEAEDGQKSNKNKSDKDKKAAKEEEEKQAKKASKKDTIATDNAAQIVSSVTLALSPDQAERLALAEEIGSLRLVLRGDSDYTISATTAVTTRDMFPSFKTKKTPPQVSSAKSFPQPPVLNSMFEGSTLQTSLKTSGQVELIQGTDRSSVSF